jgi:hypothetical protein
LCCNCQNPLVKKNQVNVIKFKKKIQYLFKATECLERRCGRPDSELVRDEPEEELIKEIALISEIKRQLNQTLADMDTQQVR